MQIDNRKINYISRGENEMIDKKMETFNNSKTKLKVINLTDEDEFEEKVNSLLELGYQISSTSCGFINSSKYNFDTSFQAILIK